MSNARIDIEVGDLYISLEGSESFVKEQYALITSQLGLFETQTRESAKKEIAGDEPPTQVLEPEVAEPVKEAPEPVKAETKKKVLKAKAPATKEAPATKKEVKKTKTAADEPLAPSAALTAAIKAKSKRAAKKAPAPAAPAAAKPASKTTKSTKLPKDFKEWTQMVSGKLNKTDLALLSGFYVQLNSDKQAFRVREASKILRNSGFDLSNASIFIRNNLKSGKLFENSKVGSEAYYRLTDKGLERVKKLLGM